MARFIVSGKFTLPIFKQELQKKIHHSSLLIKKTCEMENEKTYLGKNLISVNLVQRYAFINDNAFNDKVFKKIILDSCEKAERISGGAGELCFLLISRLLEQYMPMVRSGSCSRSIRESMRASLDINLTDTEKASTPMTKTIIEKIINSSFDNDELRLIVKSALRLAGKNREIRVEKSNFQQTHIFLKDGCDFPISTSEYFLGTMLTWDRSDVSCIVIDGAIIEVSEIHHLLQKHAEEKTPCIIFARNFSNDVLNTLLTNKKRGSLDVIPISVGMTEETINILSDIAAICGCDVVSSLKGELISSAVKEILPVVDKIKIKKNSTFIQNKKSISNVRRQISSLVERQEGTTKEAVVALLENRIRALTSDIVCIRIGSNILSKNPITIEELDTFFRKISAFIRFGIIDFKKTDSVFLNDQSKFLKENIFPTSSLSTANKIATSTVSSILSAGCSIIQDI